MYFKLTIYIYIIFFFLNPLFAGLDGFLTGLVRFILPTDQIQTEFLQSFLFPKPLLMFRLTGCGRWGNRDVMWILYDGCMGGVSCVFAGLGVTPLWLKRISRCTFCACARCQTARLNFDRFNSSHFFWKISMNHKFPFFGASGLCWIWSSRLIFIYAGGKFPRCLLYHGNIQNVPAGRSQPLLVYMSCFNSW